MPFAGCVGCRDRPSCQLGVESIALVGERGASATLVCPGSYAGGPGVAHGGWTAAVLDEVIGQFFALRQLLAVTATLRVDYRRPVPVEQALLIEARAGRRTGRRWDMTAELLLAANSATLATASGAWVERDLNHFARHEEWLRQQVEPAGPPEG